MKRSYQQAEIEEQKIQQTRLIARLKLDLEAIAQTPPGRRYLFYLLDRTGAMRSPYSNSNEDTAYNCGRQSVGIELFGALLDTDEDFLGKLRREWKEMQKTL